jgi:hypothetical protein
MIIWSSEQAGNVKREYRAHSKRIRMTKAELELRGGESRGLLIEIRSLIEEARRQPSTSAFLLFIGELATDSERNLGK